MIPPSIYNKKRISKEEFDKLPEEEKDKWEFNLLDSDFSPGCGDDICLSYRVQKEGLNIYQANFWVDHHRLTEHFVDNEQIKKEHAEYFRKKYNL